MRNIIQIAVKRGDPSSNEVEEMTDHILVVVGDSYWKGSIEQWRRMVNNIELKILNLHSKVTTVNPSSQAVICPFCGAPFPNHYGDCQDKATYGQLGMIQ